MAPYLVAGKSLDLCVLMLPVVYCCKANINFQTLGLPVYKYNRHATSWYLIN